MFTKVCAVTAGSIRVRKMQRCESNNSQVKMTLTVVGLLA